MPPPAAARLDVSGWLAWAGAVLFGASLVWAMVAYTVRFGAGPAPLPMVSAVVIDVLLFSGFALHHSLLARRGARQLVQQLLPAELERSAYTWVASLLFISVCTWWQPVPGIVYSLDGAPRLLGYAVQITGLALTLAASARLDPLDLAGVRQVQRARAGDTRAPHVPLETSGLYGFVRHPLYFAWVLMVFGTPDLTATRLTFALTSTAYLALAIPWEEQGLVGIYGAEYQAYRRQVPWRMIPFLY